MSADFVFGHVPRRVGVRGPLEVAELRVVGGGGDVQRRGEHHLQQLVALVPRYLRVEGLRRRWEEKGFDK